MLKDQYAKGQQDALAKLKLAALSSGAKVNAPSTVGQSAVPAPTNVAPALTPPASAAPPLAAGAAKSQVLG